MCDERQLGDWRAMMARGKVVHRLWPGGAAGSAEGVMSRLADAVIVHGVDPLFTAAFVDFARALHEIALAGTPKPPDATRHSATEATEGIAESRAQAGERGG
jgi:hypothetical protein